MNHADLIIRGGCVLCMDAKDSYYAQGSVAVRCGEIVGVGYSRDVDREWVAAETLDASGHVVMPGLINTHGHASNSLIRGLGGDQTLEQWLTHVCWPMMFGAEDEDLYAGVLLSFLEMLENGITTTADMWKGVEHSARAAYALGMRALVASNIKDFGDPALGRREIAENLAVHERWNGEGSDRVSIGLGLHSVYTCTADTVRACADLARSKGLHIQVHAAETEQEVAECREKNRGKTPIQQLSACDLISSRTLLAHAVWVDEADADLIVQGGAAVSHNISSNLKLGSGIAPLAMFREKGICVALGTDGPGSNDGLDLLRDLRTAVFSQRGIQRDPTLISSRQALEMVTCSGARALSLEQVTGTIEIGKRADIITVNLDQPHLTPHYEGDKKAIQSLLVYCATGRDVDHVFVDGELLVVGGRHLKVDRNEVMSRAQQASRKLLALKKD